MNDNLSYLNIQLTKSGLSTLKEHHNRWKMVIGGNFGQKKKVLKGTTDIFIPHNNDLIIMTNKNLIIFAKVISSKKVININTWVSSNKNTIDGSLETLNDIEWEEPTYYWWQLPAIINGNGTFMHKIALPTEICEIEIIKIINDNLINSNKLGNYYNMYFALVNHTGNNTIYGSKNEK